MHLVAKLDMIDAMPQGLTAVQCSAGHDATPCAAILVIWAQEGWLTDADCLAAHTTFTETACVTLCYGFIVIFHSVV